MKLTALFEVGFSGGEADFRINGLISTLSHEQMNRMRAMIVVGIGTMEDMWRREQQERNPAQQEEET
jgi:hypothetical protein